MLIDRIYVESGSNGTGVFIHAFVAAFLEKCLHNCEKLALPSIGDKSDGYSSAGFPLFFFGEVRHMRFFLVCIWRGVWNYPTRSQDSASSSDDNSDTGPDHPDRD